MLERVGSGDGGQLLLGQCAEGAARCREPQLFHVLHALAHQALIEGAMLAVNRVEHALGVLQQAVDEFTGHYQGLLVGQGNALACTDGGNRRFQPAVAHHGGHHGIYLGGGDSLGDGGAAGGYLDVGVLECVAHILIVLLVGDDDHVGAHLACLLDEQVGAAAGHQQPGMEQGRVLGNDIERLTPDGPRAAQHCNISSGLSHTRSIYYKLRRYCIFPS